MKVMRVEDKYRILLDGEYLPEEIVQSKLDNSLAYFKDAVEKFRSSLKEYATGYNLENNVIKYLLNHACFDVDDGKNWKLEDLFDEIENLQKYLKTSTDVIPSYEESETILDKGFKDEWGDSQIFEKKLEDNEEREVVEELYQTKDGFVHRKRTTIWEKTDYGRHSKEIKYEELPIDEDLKRVLDNSQSFMKLV